MITENQLTDGQRFITRSQQDITFVLPTGFQIDDWIYNIQAKSRKTKDKALKNKLKSILYDLHRLRVMIQ